MKFDVRSERERRREKGGYIRETKRENKKRGKGGRREMNLKSERERERVYEGNMDERGKEIKNGSTTG